MHGIKLISGDLSREETIMQVIQAMEQVEKLSSDVLNRVQSKFDDVQKRLEKYNNRIQDAQNKMVALKNRANEAITVYAVPKYPDSLSDSPVFRALFDRYTDRDENFKNFNYSLSTKLEKINVATCLKEKKVHYNVPVKKTTGVAEKPGYDNIPANLKFVSNLFVFNTTLNPFAKSGSYEDPFLTKSKTRSNPQIQEESNSDENLGSAPVTITNSDLNDRPGLETFTYRPNFSNVPDFDVPDLLPDLPGIADLTFSGDLSLASTIPALSIGGELPEIPMLNVSNSNAALSLNPDYRLTKFGQPEGLATAIPSPPPPPPPQPNPASTKAGPSTGPTVAFPSLPPPPPPPPPTLIVVPPQIEKPATETQNKASGDRSDLLRSIRDAGGAEKFKFRSAAERQRDKKLKRDEEKETGIADKEPSSGSTAAGGDMMADLTRALMLRRKGISGRNSDSDRTNSTGKKNKQNSLGTGVLAKLSDLIPSSVDEKGKNSASEGDWED